MAGVVYFSGARRNHRETAVTLEEPAKTSAKAPREAPADAGKTGEDTWAPLRTAPDSVLPPGPSIPPGPAFSSKDLPSDPPPSHDLLALNRPAPVPALKPPTAPELARIAIVIDDFGPDLEIAKKFLSLPFPVTFSVLPYQAHSAEIAQLAHSQGREVILHFPMEPHGYPKTDPGRGALLLSMSESAMRQNVETALDISPYFHGINNHMGSRITEDQRAMKTVLDEVNRRGLFFIDSCTSSKSKAWSVARELKVPSRRRDIFLDHDPSPRSIRAQIARLVKTARQGGMALAIGHPREATLGALQEASGQFEKQNIKIVPASDLMSRP